MASLLKGLTHSVKKTYVSYRSDSTVSVDKDATFDATKRQFDLYNETLKALQHSAGSFGHGFNHILGQGRAFWTEVNEALPMTEGELEGDKKFRPMIRSLHSSHQGFGGTQDLQLSKHYLERVTQPIAEHLNTHTQIQALISDRMKAAEELDYYLKKVDELEKDHNKLNISVKEQEKYDRNLKKKTEVHDTFVRLNADCIRKMQEQVSGRVVFLGNIAKGMLETERMLLDIINKAVGQAVGVDVTSEVPRKTSSSSKFDSLHRSMQDNLTPPPPPPAPSAPRKYSNPNASPFDE